MNLIFARSPSMKLRLTLAVMLSFIFMGVDKYTDGSATLRAFLNSLVTPIYYLASIPEDSFDWTVDQFKSREALQQENQQLKRSQLLQSEKLQQFEFLKKENDTLRALLDSKVRQQGKKMIAQVMSIDSHPFRDVVVINKGFASGVYEGQPVIDEFGLVGQVTSVATTSSRVILISDTTHATPVRIQRNGVRAMIEGSGRISSLKANNIPHSIDMIEGDIMVTSGLGGVFPEGYPVAKITMVEHDLSLPFAQISAEPVAQLDRVNRVLLLWDNRPQIVPGVVIKTKSKGDESQTAKKPAAKTTPPGD
jgi:rod shape-determining protein MreC